MVKNTATARRIAYILDESESHQRLAFTKNDRDRMAFRRHMNEGDIISPGHGLFARASYWDTLNHHQKILHHLRAESLRNPHKVFGSFYASLAFGINVSYQDLKQVSSLTPRQLRDFGINTRQTPHVVSSPCSWDDFNERGIYRVNGITVVSPKIAVTSSLLEARLPNGLALADSTLRQFGISKTQLMDTIEELGYNRSGIAQARSIASYADPRSESGAESVARGRIIEEGYPVPDLQVVLTNPLDMRRTFRVDFLWRTSSARAIIGEVDGMVKYTDPHILQGRSAIDALADERQRESALSAHGYPIVRFLAKQLFEPGYINQRLDAVGINRVR